MKHPRRMGVAISLTLAIAVIMLMPLPSISSGGGDRTLRVEASSFSYNPGTVRVNPGERVTIELVAKDVVHGLYIDGYGHSIIADPGQTARLSFVADRSGSFRFRCSVTCGALHPFMVGKLVVGRNWLLWRAVALAVLVAAGGVLVTWRRPAWT